MNFVKGGIYNHSHKHRMSGNEHYVLKQEDIFQDDYMAFKNIIHENIILNQKRFINASKNRDTEKQRK